MTRFFDQFPSAGPLNCEKGTDFLTDEDATEFVVTAINSGSGSVVDTEVGGALVLTGAATTDDSGAEAQDDAAWIGLVAGKRLRFSTRLKVSDADQCDLYAGVGTLDTSMIASEPTAYIGFKKLDETAVLSFIVRAAGVQTGAMTTGTSLADATYARLEFEVTPSAASAALGDVLAYVDGVLVATLRGVVLPTTMMARAVAFQSGNATGTHTCTVDWVAATFQR